MKFLLDTNMCIYLIKKKPPQVLERFNDYSVGEIGVSSITVAELGYGVEKSQRPTQNRRALGQFLIPLVIADFDEGAAEAYGKVQGKPIGALDTLIAAHALSLEVTLVTNNTREFSRVPDLRLVNWAED